MAIDLGYNDFSLFKILGRAAAVIKNQGSNVAAQKTALSVNLNAQLANEVDIQAVVGGGYLGALSSLGGSVGPLMQGVASQALDRVIYRDAPRTGQTLTAPATLASLQELIRQMKAAGATVLAQTVAATPGSFSGGGDAQLNFSLYRPGDGAALENAYAEILTAICSADSYVGGAVSGNETVRITGGGQQSDVFAFDWPAGSGCDASLACIDGSASNSSGNLLTYSGWENWSGGAPSNWEVITGGSLISQNGGTAYDGAYSLQLTGDGATNLRMRQLFGSSSGTSGTLNPLAQYSFCGWRRRDGTAAGAGTLKVSLKDASGTVLVDANMAANSVTDDLTALTTDWMPFTADFRTPLVLPSAYYLEVETTTPLSSGRSVYLDRFGLGAMTQLYVHGPFAACHSGAAPLRQGARATVSVTNGRGSGGTLDTWQTFFFRAFSDVRTNELLLPSSGSPSVLDSWIA